MQNSFISEVIFPTIITTVILFLGCVATPIISLDYYSSCVESRIYNQRNDTNYTCSDFFWAGDQINQQTQTIKISN